MKLRNNIIGAAVLAFSAAGNYACSDQVGPKANDEPGSLYEDPPIKYTNRDLVCDERFQVQGLVDLCLATRSLENVGFDASCENGAKIVPAIRSLIANIDLTLVDKELPGLNIDEFAFSGDEESELPRVYQSTEDPDVILNCGDSIVGRKSCYLVDEGDFVLGFSLDDKCFSATYYYQDNTRTDLEEGEDGIFYHWQYKTVVCASEGRTFFYYHAVSPPLGFSFPPTTCGEALDEDARKMHTWIYNEFEGL